MATKLLSFLLWFNSLYSEILIYNSTNKARSTVIRCLDPSSDCVITCIGDYICDNSMLHCHNESTTSTCTINAIGSNSIRASTIYTHQSPKTYINIDGYQGLYNSIIYAHEKLGSQLYIWANAWYALRFSELYAPVGVGSILSMECGIHSCRDMEIFEDWTTEVYLQHFGDNANNDAFEDTIIKNIFDNSTLNITREDPNYDGLDVTYRASVFLNGCDKDASRSWNHFKYYGHNHGNWTLYGLGYRNFRNTEIYATSDMSPSANAPEYNIYIIGSPAGDINNDNDINDQSFREFTLEAGHNMNVYVEVTENTGFQGAKIYAKYAKSVNIYCHEGGDCDAITVECPVDNANNACKIWCDKSATTCHNMKIFTTNGYCVDAAILCDGNDCNMGTGTNIYCGQYYNQTDDYCNIDEIDRSGEFECVNNVNATKLCNNNYTEASCQAMLNDTPIAISSLFDSICYIPTMPPTEMTISPAPSISPSPALTEIASKCIIHRQLASNLVLKISQPPHFSELTRLSLQLAE